MKDKRASEAQPADEPQQKFFPSAHPSRSLGPRAKGYGIGGGYEKPYRERSLPKDHQSVSYGPVPHAGYYGAGAGDERFERGQAGFGDELSWYEAQYGETTSGRSNKKS
jgi:hypothetical protein